MGCGLLFSSEILFLVGRVIVVPSGMSAAVSVHPEVRLGPTCLLDVHDPEVRGAFGPFRHLTQHLDPCRVLAFQPRKRKSGSAVLVLQHPYVTSWRRSRTRSI